MEYLFRWSEGPRNNRAPVQKLQTVPVFRYRGTASHDYFCGYVCTGVSDVYSDGSCAEFPDTDRERICGSGCDPVVFRRTDPDNSGREGQTGL